VRLGWILTCYGFKPAQYHPIHVDYHQNEQALNTFQNTPIHMELEQPNKALGIYRVFGLRNQSIQIKLVHHGFIPHIWWDDTIPHISTN
jgi:hypothetical protein